MSGLPHLPVWAWAAGFGVQGVLIWFAVRRFLRWFDRRCARQIEVALSIHHRLHHRPIVETALSAREAESVGLRLKD